MFRVGDPTKNYIGWNFLPMFRVRDTVRGFGGIFCPLLELGASANLVSTELQYNSLPTQLFPISVTYYLPTFNVLVPDGPDINSTTLFRCADSDLFSMRGRS